MKSVAGLVVGAEIVAQAKGDKVTVFKKRRRHNYRRKAGHRQNHTILKIVSIGGEKAKPVPSKAEGAAKPKAEAAPAEKPAAAPAKAEAAPAAETPAKSAEPKAKAPSTKDAAPAKAAAKKAPKAK